jgi:hypothetical protein
MTNLEKAVKDPQDNLLVLAEIERRQSEMLREHSEVLVVNERNIANLNAESAVFQHRTDQNLAEITDKLNGLIGYMDGLQRPPKE